MLAGGKSLRVSQSLSESLRLRQSERDQPGLRSCDVYLGNLALVRCPLTRRQISHPSHLPPPILHIKVTTGSERPGIALKRIPDCGCHVL